MHAKILDKSMIEAIPVVTMLNSYEVSVILSKVKDVATILFPIPETTHSLVETIPQ